MLIVVAYDIVDNRRRQQLAQALKDLGSPRQKSLFECSLKLSEQRQLIRQIKSIIHPRQDAVRIYHICAACERQLPTGKVVRGMHEPVIV